MANLFTQENNMHRLLTTKEAARFLGMSSAFLERDRWAGAQIPFVRVGARAVRYDIDVLEAYAKARVRKSTTGQEAQKQGRR